MENHLIVLSTIIINPNFARIALMSLRGTKRRGNLTTWRLPLGHEPLGLELGAERLEAEWLR
jgi:hypothetical protein